MRSPDYRDPATASSVVKAARSSGKTDAEIAVLLECSTSLFSKWESAKNGYQVNANTARRLRRLDRRLK